jgi:hypothetical protein
MGPIDQHICSTHKKKQRSSSEERAVLFSTPLASLERRPPCGPSDGKSKVFARLHAQSACGQNVNIVRVESWSRGCRLVPARTVAGIDRTTTPLVELPLSRRGSIWC